MGGASAVLDRRRAAAFAALAAVVLAYYLTYKHLWEAPLWWDIAWLDVVLMPAVFGLVYLALPLWRARGLPVVGLACAAVAAVCHWQDVDILGNFAKLAAMTLLAWWFLGFFESLSWVVLVASIIPLVDIYSVFKGPTKEITTNHPETFAALSYVFPAPGDGAAHLGLPDLLFFALFLAAAARWGLRVFWTWLAMVVSFGATMVLAVGTGADGLPALPLLSVAFVLANADLIWRRLRRHRAEDTL